MGDVVGNMERSGTKEHAMWKLASGRMNAFLKSKSTIQKQASQSRGLDQANPAAVHGGASRQSQLEPMAIRVRGKHSTIHE